jgi:hypothetical protein
MAIPAQLRRLIERYTVKVSFASELEDVDELLEQFLYEALALPLQQARRRDQPTGNRKDRPCST